MLGTDHSETWVHDWALTWAVGAALGLGCAVLAGLCDRRYLPWTAAFMLTGVFAGSMSGLSYRGIPFVVVGPVLGVSVVLHALAGRRQGAPATLRRRDAVAGVLVTAVVLTVVGAATVHVVVATRSTPLYDAMRSDPLAADRLPGLIVRFDHSKDQTTPLGIPSDARVVRVWRTADGSPAGDERKEVAALAERSGWVDGPDPVSCGWRRTIEGHRLCLVIRRGPSRDEVWVEISEEIT